MIVGEYIADFCDRSENDVDIPTGVVHGYLEREQAKLAQMLDGRGTERAGDLRVAMQQIMTAKVGIFRRGRDLEQAVEELQALLVRSRNIGVRGRAAGANPELVMAYRTQKMLKLALAIAYGALVRTESRGAHYREDYPRRNDAEWLKRTLARWTNERDTLPTFTYETLDVSAMELPPGWRGYGAKDYIEHPEAAARQTQVDELKAQRAPAGRFAVQEALMPYDELLPPGFRGKNERIDERF
jgi:fumarate reductase flavoprotein subunit